MTAVYVCLSVRLSVRPFVCPFVCLSNTCTLQYFIMQSYVVVALLRCTEILLFMSHAGLGSQSRC